MSIILTLLVLALIAAAGYVLAHKVVPRVFVKALGLVGIHLRTTPMMRKRISRFVSIRRGYWAFIIITTAFVISLFLELLVNDKALLIVYEDEWAMPAVSEWVDLIPGVSVPHYLPGEKFGQLGEAPVEYRQFQAQSRDPSLLRTEIEQRTAKLQERRKRFEGKRAPKRPTEPAEPREPPKPEDPGAGATEAQKEAYQDALDEWNDDHEEWEDDHADWVEDTKDYKDDLRFYAEDVKDYAEARKDLDAIQAEIAQLEKTFTAFEKGRAWAIMPLYPFHPNETLLEELPGRPPHWPNYRTREKDAAERTLTLQHQPLGTTDNGIDVLCQLLYGFRIALVFALLCAGVGYTIGILVGGIMGYYGGWTDILVQRFIEIWGSIPFLFTMMIIASIIKPSLLVMAGMLIALRSWMGITWTVRGEFYREKARDYVQAAVAMGVSDWKIITRHILPNSLVPVVTFAPFGIVAYIGTLVSLDYLGYGLKPGTPSWGYLLQQGQTHLSTYWFLIVVPVLAFAGTLFCVVTIGEAVREGFDPKVFSRLR